jgi:CheY-like chemotaxis protein
MPRLDGLSATRRIRIMEDRKDTPIVAMTANAMNGDRRECLEAGMSDYIAKPYDIGAFLAKIALLIDDARSARSATAVHAASPASASR